MRHRRLGCARFAATQSARQFAHDANGYLDIAGNDTGKCRAIDTQQLRWRACDRAGKARLILEDRHFAEEVAGAKRRQRLAAACRSHDVDAAGFDDEHLGAGVALAKHDLTRRHHHEQILRH